MDLFITKPTRREREIDNNNKYLILQRFTKKLEHDINGFGILSNQIHHSWGLRYSDLISQDLQQVGVHY